MTRAPSLMLALGLAMPLALAAPSAVAQPLGLGRRLDAPRATPPPPPAEPAPAEAPSAAERPFPGPQVQLHYEHFRLSDGWGAGDVHAGGLAVFVRWPLTQLRTGLLAELGGRDYALGASDLIVRGGAEVGFQLTELLDPFVPHLSVVAAFGVVVEERFETTVVHGLGGAGLELGAEVRLHGDLHLAAAVGYLRLEMDGAAFDVFLVRLGAGL